MLRAQLSDLGQAAPDLIEERGHVRVDLEHADDLVAVRLKRKLLGLPNRLLPDDGPKLYLTDPRFSRKNGPFAHQPYDGPERLPTAEDEAALQEIFEQPGWIAPAQS